MTCGIVVSHPLLGLDAQKNLTQYAHRVWGQQEGLLQPTVYSVLQTTDGFLWLGTQDGLFRFDGVDFREYDASAAAFEGKLIRALASDANGNVWVASIGGGLARISPDGRVRRYGAEDGIHTRNAYCVTSDTGNAIWACTDEGLIRISGGAVRTFTTVDGLAENRVRTTCRSTDGVRWVAGLDSGLSRWTGSHFEPYIGSGFPADERITALACAGDGSVWAGGSELFRIADGHVRRLGIRDGLPDARVSSIAEDSSGGILVGTDEGITRFHNGSVSVFRIADGLSHRVVLSLYIDHEGSLWAGTKNGLDQFTDSKVTPYTRSNGFAGGESGPVITDSHGRLWVGTPGRGLAWLDGDRFRAFQSRGKLLDNTVLSLEAGPDGELWVGTTRGLNRLRNGIITGAWTTANGLSGREVRAIFVDRQGAVWAGTDRGLDRFDGHRFAEPGFADSDSVGVTALSGGTTVQLFAGLNSRGLYLIRDHRFLRYPMEALSPVDCYYLDHAHHTAWMGTLGSGLLRWKNGLISRLGAKDGLYDNRIYGIVADEDSHVWLASSKGIFRVNARDLDDFADGKISSVVSTPFGTGQLRFECQAGVQPAAWKAPGGRLWFSTSDGPVMIDPAHLETNKAPPPVAITGVLVNGQPVNSMRRIEIRAGDERNVEIRYAGLSFISPEKVTFRYRLEGFDRKWTRAGTTREAIFTNLPPGHFRFDVVARNADGVPSMKAATIDLLVDPAFYQRWDFFIGLAALAALSIVASYRVRVYRLRQSFDLVIAERGRIARELHDTLLQGLAGISMQMQALWSRLPVSEEKTLLGGIINDARQCAQEARQSLWELRTPASGGDDFPQQLELMARGAIKTGAMILRTHIDALDLTIAPEAEFQLLRIAREAICNAVKHSRASMLVLRLELRKGILRLSVEDNGIGFCGRRRAAGHFGLVDMQERASSIGARLVIRSKPGIGTKVLVSFLVEGKARRGRIPLKSSLHTVP